MDLANVTTLVIKCVNRGRERIRKETNKYKLIEYKNKQNVCIKRFKSKLMLELFYYNMYIQYVRKIITINYYKNRLPLKTNSLLIYLCMYTCINGPSVFMKKFNRFVC